MVYIARQQLSEARKRRVPLATLAMAMTVAISRSAARSGAPQQVPPMRPGASIQAIDVQTLRPVNCSYTMRLKSAHLRLSHCHSRSTIPRAFHSICPMLGWHCPRGALTCIQAGLDTILAAEGKDRTRLVLNLDKLVPYDTRVDGNNIIVMLGSAYSHDGSASASARCRRSGRGRGTRSRAIHKEHRLPPRRRRRRPHHCEAHRSAHAYQPASDWQSDRRGIQWRRIAAEPDAPL